MYDDNLSFDESEFLRIYEAETDLFKKNGGNEFSRLCTSQGPESKNIFLADIKRAVNIVYNAAYQGLTPRYAAVRAKDYKVFTMPESVAAHTLIVKKLYNCFRDALFTHRFNVPVEVFEYAIGIHDLPENKFKDIPDNACAEHDDGSKEANEQEFYLSYRNNVSRFELDKYDAALRLINSAKTLKTPDSRVFLLADKFAAPVPLLTAYFDMMTDINNGAILEPSLVENFIAFDYSTTEKLTSRERECLKLICGTRKPSNPIQAYEIYTCDFLSVRKTVQYDDYGFFTAFLIAYTLACHNNEWYRWRENQYDSKFKRCK